MPRLEYHVITGPHAQIANALNQVRRSGRQIAQLDVWPEQLPDGRVRVLAGLRPRRRPFWRYAMLALPFIMFAGFIAAAVLAHEWLVRQALSVFVGLVVSALAIRWYMRKTR
jgi:hypothetical protein